MWPFASNRELEVLKDRVRALELLSFLDEQDLSKCKVGDIVYYYGIQPRIIVQLAPKQFTLVCLCDDFFGRNSDMGVVASLNAVHAYMKSAQYSTTKFE